MAAQAAPPDHEGKVNLSLHYGPLDLNCFELDATPIAS